MVADRDPAVGVDFGSHAFDFRPAGCDADLVVAQHVVGYPKPVRAAVRPWIFKRRIETATHHYVECDGGVLGGIETHSY